MNDEHVLEGLRNWCLECDDEFVGEYNATDVDVTSTCAERGHGRALTDADFEWRICHRCRGEGRLGGWPGAYTESDRAEWSEEHYEDYHTTRRTCEDCAGAGKIRELTEAARNRPIVDEWFKDYYDTEATYRAERAMGA